LKYRTILADPPWPVDFKSTLGQGRKDQYPTMTVEDIKNLPVAEYTDKECSLFIWTTHTFLPVTFEIIKGWGFKYHITLTWNKGSGLTCFGFHRCSELCLYAYKGKMNIKQNGTAMKTILRPIPDFFDESATIHSRKPAVFYRMLERSTETPRLELFARNKRAGWDVFGNEVESDIQLIGEKVL